MSGSVQPALSPEEMLLGANGRRATAWTRSEESCMSDQVTWEACPDCGTSAAVGWTKVREITGPSVVWMPAEFDCPTGCHLTEDERWTAFDYSSWV
jgi:hypothetical protein